MSETVPFRPPKPCKEDRTCLRRNETHLVPRKSPQNQPEGFACLSKTPWDEILLSFQPTEDCTDQKSTLLGADTITSSSSLLPHDDASLCSFSQFPYRTELPQPDMKEPDTKMILSRSSFHENHSYRTSTSPFPAQVTVEVQVDGLDGSAIINLTRGAGSDIAGLTSDSPISGGFTPSPTKSVPLTSQGIFNLVNPSTGYNVSAFLTQPAIPGSMASSSQSFNTSALHSPPLTSATSANVSDFKGSGLKSSQGLFDPTVVLISGLSQLAVAIFFSVPSMIFKTSPVA